MALAEYFGLGNVKPLKTKSVQKNIETQNKMRNCLVQENYDKQKELESIEENYFEKRSNNSSNIIHTNTFNRMKNTQKRTKLREDLTFKFFTDKLFSIFNESLVLDDYVKRDYKVNLKNVVKNTIRSLQEAGQFSKNYILKESSEYIKGLYLLCEAKAKENSENMLPINQGKNDGATERSENELEVLDEDDDYNTDSYDDFSDLSPEESDLSELVREKVVTVIYDEQETSRKESELDEGITNDIKDMSVDHSEDLELDEEDEGSEDYDDEGNYADDEGSIEEDEGKDNSELDEFPDKEEEEKVEESTKFKIIPRMNKLKEMSLFKSLQYNIGKKYLKELSENKCLEPEKLKESKKDILLSMDHILAETVIYYTLLEVLHTTKLVNFNSLDAKDLARELFIESSFDLSKNKKKKNLNEELDTPIRNWYIEEGLKKIDRCQSKKELDDIEKEVENYFAMIRMNKGNVLNLGRSDEDKYNRLTKYTSKDESEYNTLKHKLREKRKTLKK